MSAVTGASAHIHFHPSGAAAVEAATRRARNSTIVIGGDQEKGTLLLDIDVQQSVCSGIEELLDQLEMVVEALRGQDMEQIVGGDEA